MKVTKYTHSCVLVEANGKTALFDPGVWTHDLSVADLTAINYIIYTHEHADHLSVDTLRLIVEKFPDVMVICNQPIQNIIEDAGITVAIAQTNDDVTVFASNHEALPIPGAQAPAQNGYHFADFTHPGDSHHFSETKRVLAMPFVGPWGKPGDAIALVLELKPEYVLPIHDWHYSVEGRHWYDGLFKTALEDAGITLLSSDPTSSIEID